jgi:hypothetical protein
MAAQTYLSPVDPVSKTVWTHSIFEERVGIVHRDVAWRFPRRGQNEFGREERGGTMTAIGGTMHADLVIVKLDCAKQALGEAKTIQQTKKILDIACAAEIYAKRQQLSEDAITYAGAIKIEALRQLGGLLKETPKNKGLKGSIVTGSKQEPVRDHTPTLAALGLDKKVSMIAQQLADLPQALFERVREGATSRTQALWEARHPHETNTVAWSLDSAEQRLLAAINTEIQLAPPGSQPLIADLLQRLTENLKDTDRPELREAVSIARDDLDLHDYEPGGIRIFESAEQASAHPGSPTVIGGCKSTHAEWYRGLTTKVDGGTTLRRKQIEARLDDVDRGKLPTARTANSYFAVRWAIQFLPRTSPLNRGGQRSQ